MAMGLTTPKGATPSQRATLRILARTLDDIEQVRIMVGNRIGALVREHGGTLPHLEEILGEGRRWEHVTKLELVRVWRKDPLAPWAHGVRGLGELSIARLIGELGDPSVGSVGHWETRGHQSHDAHDGNAPLERVWVVDAHYDRSVSQLWQYCGVGDPKRSRLAQGATQAEILARGNPRIKKQLYLIATAMLKAGNRAVYDEARERYAERVHSKPCPQCRAKTGDPWKPGHQHAAALRKVAKEFLKELWREDRRLREIGELTATRAEAA
jgi:hypothetical protein